MSSVTVVPSIEPNPDVSVQTKKCQWISFGKYHRESLIATRLFMLVQMGLVIYLAVCLEGDKKIIAGVLACFVIIAETVFLIFKHGSRDFHW